MSIRKTLELSTAHLSNKSLEYLDKLSKECFSDGLNSHGIFDTNYGYFMFVTDEVKYDDPDLTNIVKYANQKECSYIVFDMDVDVCDDLPIKGDA